MIPATWSLAARIGAPALVLAAIAAAVWGYGRREYLAGREAGRTEMRELYEQRIEEANRRAHQAGEHYERLRSQAAVKTIARHKELRRANDADAVWSRAPVPDGVRHATEAAAADTAAGEPD